MVATLSFYNTCSRDEDRWVDKDLNPQMPKWSLFNWRNITVSFFLPPLARFFRWLLDSSRYNGYHRVCGHAVDHSFGPRLVQGLQTEKPTARLLTQISGGLRVFVFAWFKCQQMCTLFDEIFGFTAVRKSGKVTVALAKAHLDLEYLVLLPVRGVWMAPYHSLTKLIRILGTIWAVTLVPHH